MTRRDQWRAEGTHADAYTAAREARYHPQVARVAVVIAGGGAVGSATAYFLVNQPAFSGKIVVVEPDPTYAFVGSSEAVANLLLASGFSGHGLQHAPAIGRALAEFITFGEYRTIDVTPFSYDRYLRRQPLRERNVI